VDGDRSNLGFHSAGDTNPSVIIDLGKVETVSRVVVFNRADCCQERAVPLLVESSRDGLAYQRLGERTKVFFRWDVDVPRVPARYVRLTLERLGTFHLSEVEVY